MISLILYSSLLDPVPISQLWEKASVQQGAESGEMIAFLVFNTATRTLSPQD